MEKQKKSAKTRPEDMKEEKKRIEGVKVRDGGKKKRGIEISAVKEEKLKCVCTFRHSEKVLALERADNAASHTR